MYLLASAVPFTWRDFDIISRLSYWIMHKPCKQHQYQNIEFILY